MKTGRGLAAQASLWAQQSNVLYAGAKEREREGEREKGREGERGRERGREGEREGEKPE